MTSGETDQVPAITITTLGRNYDQVITHTIKNSGEIVWPSTWVLTTMNSGTTVPKHTYNKERCGNYDQVPLLIKNYIGICMTTYQHLPGNCTTWSCSSVHMSALNGSTILSMFEDNHNIPFIWLCDCICMYETPICLQMAFIMESFLVLTLVKDGENLLITCWDSIQKT